MHKRNRNGSAVVFIVASVLALVGIGLFCFLLVRVIGGNRELQAATDSGNLNVTKHAVAIGVPLSSLPKIDQENFQAFVDPNPSVDATNPSSTNQSANRIIDLRTYNGCIAQSILVLLNAAEDNGGYIDPQSRVPQGALHARQLIYAIEGNNLSTADSDSLAFRLSEYLGNASIVNNEQFLSTGSANSLRMLGFTKQLLGLASANDFRVGYVEANAPSSIILDTNSLGNLPAQYRNTLPVFTATSTNLNNAGSSKQFLAGYASNGIGLDPGDHLGPLYIRAVPVEPQGQPHLIAQSTFSEHRSDSKEIAPLIKQTLFPPNAFQSKGNAREIDTGKSLDTLASGVVSSLSESYADTNGNKVYSYPLAIPDGYIEIINPPGYASSKEYPCVGNIFNNELMGSGISLGYSAAGQVVCFTTDEQALVDLVAYGRSNPKPPQLPATVANAAFYDVNGNQIPATALTALSLTSTPAGRPSTCTTANTASGPDYSACPTCLNMLNAFNRAYPSDGGYKALPSTTAPPQEIALEALNDNVVSGYPMCWSGELAGVYHGSYGGLYTNTVNAYRFGVFGLSGNPNNSFDRDKAPLPFTFGLSVSRDPHAQGNDVTGLRNFNHNPAPGQGLLVPQGDPSTPTANYYLFSHADTPLNYLTEIGLGSGQQLYSSSIFQALLQRCKEIVPSTTAEYLAQILNSETLDLGDVAYIYKDQKTQKLKLVRAGHVEIVPGSVTERRVTTPTSATPGYPSGVNVTESDGATYQINHLAGAQTPPGYVSPDGSSKDETDMYGYVPDGNAVTYASAPYDVLSHNIVNTSAANSPTGLGDCSIHDALFVANVTTPTAAGTPAKPVVVQDIVKFVKSSGFRNNLGRLIFGNQVTGNETFEEPN